MANEDLGTPASPRTRLVAAVLIAAAFLSGCDVGPDYKRPDIAVPPAWREGDAAQSTAWPSADWWKSFHSPQLNEFIAGAQQANSDLGAAIARVREADAQVRIAGAALLPSIEATGGVSNQQTVSAISGNNLKYTLYNAGLGASYEVDFWGKNRAALSAAEASALASRYDQQVVALTVVTSVATTYFQAVALQDRLKVAQDNLASAEKMLEGIEAEEQAGTAMELDRVQQQTVVAGLRANIPPLEQQLSQTIDALAILIGKPPEEVKLAPSSLMDLATATVAPGLPSELLTRRPDVHEAEAQLVAANANIKVARAQFLPSIALTAQGGFESVALSTMFSPAGEIYTLAASATQPIFEGGALEGQLEYSKARYDELVQDYRKAVLTAFSDVEDSLVATRRTDEQQADEQVTVEKARQAYQISQSQFEVGTVNLLTVLTTENALFPAEDLLVQIRLAHLEALVSLFKALGGGWQDDAQADAQPAGSAVAEPPRSGLASAAARPSSPQPPNAHALGRL